MSGSSRNIGDDGGVLIGGFSSADSPPWSRHFTDLFRPGFVAFARKCLQTIRMRTSSRPGARPARNALTSEQDNRVERQRN
jgi:hypothetical protein